MTTTEPTGFLAYFEKKPKRTTPPAPKKTATELTPDGRRILNAHCRTMTDTIEGEREGTLLKLGRLIGGYIGGGEIPYEEGYDRLRDAALASGLPEWEVDSKLPRHLEYGMNEPLAARQNDIQYSGQLRMAHRLAEAYQGRLLYVHGLGWHHYDGKRWAPDDVGAATRAVIDVLKAALAESLGDKDLQRDVRKCESATGVGGVLSLAAALEPFAATVRDLDADPYLLNVSNGTLDLRTLELLPHNPADKLTKVSRAAYSRSGAGDWDRFVKAVLPNENVRGYVQRQIGVALLGKVVEHTLSIWTGTGANGKSTAINGLCWALGDYAMTAEPDLLLHREGAHPTGQMDLMGRRLAVITETDEGRRFAEATMKRLTGGDVIKARYMRQDFVEFEPSHTPILVTNHLPAVSGDDPAVWRRLRVVPFDVVIPEKDRDPELPEKLQQCADEILSWCVDGWAEYREKGLAEPAEVLAKTKEYQADSDAIGRFIEDKCVTSSPVMKARTSQLFEAWQKWRTTEAVAEISMKAFGKALDRHGYPVAEKNHEGRWRKNIALRGENT